MDEYERSVLKRRRPALVEHVQVTKDLLASLTSSGVLQPEDTAHIMSDKSNSHRIHKLLECLFECENADVFSTVCSALMVQYGWLAKELRSEVEGDRGNLHIDEDVLNEAGMVVHRKFGTSKRFSEGDKKDLQEMIAIKVQLSKEEFREELEEVKRHVNKAWDVVKERDKNTRKTDNKLLKFIKKHEEELTFHAHGMKTTTDILRDCPADDDILATLNRRLKYMMDRVTICLEQNAMLLHEKQRCLTLLHVKDNSQPLYELLRQKADESHPDSELAQLTSENSHKEKRIRRLRDMVEELENEVANEQARSNALEKAMHTKDEEIEALVSELEELKSKSAEASKVKKRTRRLSSTKAPTNGLTKK